MDVIARIDRLDVHHRNYQIMKNTVEEGLSRRQRLRSADRPVFFAIPDEHLLASLSKRCS